jgi:DNA-directed RNA polymerase specialized sigma24 family protein
MACGTGWADPTDCSCIAIDGFTANGPCAERGQLERVFQRLSADHRSVLVLSYHEGLSGAQAAERLGISPGTVASRLHYALRALPGR